MTETIASDNNASLPWVLAALLVLLTWCLYQPSLDNRFTNYDDPLYVLENAQVKQPGLQSAWYFLTHTAAFNYHPLAMMSLSFDYFLATKDKPRPGDTGEPEATVFHTTSLIIHLLNVLLVFLFTYLISRKRPIVATVTALLFSIHPMHVESVSWIAERKDVLYAFFLLAGLIGYWYYLERQDRIRLLLTGLCFAGSLLSKPSAVVFPLLMLALDYHRGRKFSKGLLFEKIPFFILSVAFGSITFFTQSQTSGFTIFQRFMFASYGFVMYQYKLLIPLNLSAVYPYPLVDASGNLPVIYYLCPLIAAAIVGLVLYSTRFTRVVCFGYLFYFFSLVLVLQFMPVGRAIMADRYTYVSAIGIFYVLAWCLDQAFSRDNARGRLWRWPLAGSFLVYTVFLGRVASEQTAVWRDSETLWTRVIANYPGDEIAYKYRGHYYSGLNSADKALQDYTDYLRIKQDDPVVYNNLGNIYGSRGEFDKSLDAYSKAIALDGLNPKTYLNRAVTFTKAKQYAPALADYAKALALKPGLIDVQANRSYTFLEMGRFQDAIADFSLLLRHFPRNDTYLLDRGLCYFRMRQYAEALVDFERAIALNPANGRGYVLISAAYNEMKDYQKNFLETLLLQSRE